MAATDIGPREVVELMAALDRASEPAVDAAGKYAVFVARERAKGLLCQRGRDWVPAAKWAGENGTGHLVNEGRAVVSPILFDCYPVRLRGAGTPQPEGCATGGKNGGKN